MYVVHVQAPASPSPSPQYHSPPFRNKERRPINSSRKAKPSVNLIPDPRLKRTKLAWQTARWWGRGSGSLAGENIPRALTAKRNARFLNVELRGGGFGDGLHVRRQLLLHGTAGAAIPLHYLHAAASVAAVEELAWYCRYVLIAGRFKDRKRAATELFEGTTLVKGQLTV